MTPHVLVIGAGAMGLSAALALVRRGLSVTVADQGQAGQSSWAGAGILSPLPPWQYPETVSRLAMAGMRAWPEWAASLAQQSGIDPEFWACGMAVRLENGREHASDWCQAHQLAVEIRKGQIWLPEIAQIRNPRLLAAMKKSLAAAGGTLLENSAVTELDVQNGRARAAITSRGKLDANLFVLAAGAWSGRALGALAPVPNIRPVRGQMLLYAPGSHQLGHIVLQDGFYLVPRRDGHLLAGSTVEHAGFDALTTDEALDALHRQACAMLPSLSRHQPINSWAGLRPGSPGNLPVIDRHPDVENLWLHTGHFRYGVTMAPASSRLLAELVHDESPFLDPSPYSWQAAIGRDWRESSAC